LRVARHGGKEDVKVAATLRRPRWRSEEENRWTIIRNPDALRGLVESI